LDQFFPVSLGFLILAWFFTSLAQFFTGLALFFAGLARFFRFGLGSVFSVLGL